MFRNARRLVLSLSVLALAFAPLLEAANIQIRDLPTTVVLPAANQYFITDGATQGTAKLLVSVMTQVVTTKTALSALSITNVPTGVTVRTLGGATLGDGAGALYYYSSTSTATANGTSVIAPNVGSGRWLIVVDSGLSLPTTTTLGGVFAKAAVANQFITSLGTDGNFVTSPITTSNISGLGTMATQNSNAVIISGGSITGITPLAIAQGGTGAADANAARIALGAASSAVTMTKSANLSDVVDIAASRTNLGLGTLATQNGTFSGSFSGTSSGVNTGDQTITLTGAVTGSGTGSFTTTLSSNYVTNAMLVQVPTATFKARNTAGTGAPQDLTVAQAKALLNFTTADIGGLGTMSAQNAGSVAITGGSITGTSASLTSLGVSGTTTLSGLLNVSNTITANNLHITSPAATDSSAFLADGSTTGYSLFRLTNTAGGLSFGIEGAAGNSILYGAPAYSTVIGSNVNQPVYFSVNNVVSGGLTSTGATAAAVRAAMGANATFTTAALNTKTFINVMSFGATGDGSTNDTAAIAAALAAIPSTGGTLYIPRGTFITDTISITGKTKLTIIGDGMGSSILKSRTGAQVLNGNNVADLNISGLTFNGNCTARTAGQQAVILDGVRINFFQNEIVNSGEFAIMVGYYGTSSDVHVHHNLIGNNFADGINFQGVTRGIIDNNMITGSDDDCIAVGYSGATGAPADQIIVSNNLCRARSDLATAWGRGILVLRATNVQIIGNTVEHIKQTGILIESDSNTTSTFPTGIMVVGNRISGVAINSGHGIQAYRVNQCTIAGNVIENNVTGSNLIEIADWSELTIRDNTLTQSLNVFARGIHCAEGTGFSRSTWNRLRLINNTISLTGAATNSAIYLYPDAAYTQQFTFINANTVDQVVAGTYISVNRTGTKCAVTNNVSLDPVSVNTYTFGGVGTAPKNYNN